MAGLDTEGPARMNGRRRRPTSRLQVTTCEVIWKASYCNISPRSHGDQSRTSIGGGRTQLASTDSCGLRAWVASREHVSWADIVTTRLAAGPLALAVAAVVAGPYPLGRPDP